MLPRATPSSSTRSLPVLQRLNFYGHSIGNCELFASLIVFVGWIANLQLITCVEAGKWFEETVPALARLLIRLPSLLEGHYRNADHIFGKGCGIETGLRVLASQEIGIVVLSQVNLMF